MEHGRSSLSFATEEGCSCGCRVCEGTLLTPKIKENRFCHQNACKKIACGMQSGYSFLRGRHCAATRSPTPHGSTYGTPSTLRTVPNGRVRGCFHVNTGSFSRKRISIRIPFVSCLYLIVFKNTCLILRFFDVYSCSKIPDCILKCVS